MCWSNREHLTCDRQAPRVARTWCQWQVGSHLGDERGVADLLYDLTLVVSELVTNSVCAGCTDLSIAVTLHRHWLDLAVFDDADGIPRPREAGLDDRTGRGLAITAALTNDWGTRAARSGKEVWARLLLPTGSFLAVDCLETAV